MTDAAAIGFELRFTGTSGADAAAEARERAAEPTRRGMRYLSCASSTCSWPSRVRARLAKMSRMSWVRSSTRDGGRALEIAQLGRRQLVVEDDEIGVESRRRRREHLDLAPAEERRGIGCGTLLQEAQHDIGAGRTGEPFELVETCARPRLRPSGAGDEPDQRRALDRPHRCRAGAGFPVLASSPQRF